MTPQSMHVQCYHACNRQCMRSAILGFVAGITWLQAQAILPSFTVSLGLFILAVLCMAGAWICCSEHIRLPVWVTETGMRLIFLCGAGVLTGFLWAALLAHYYLSHALPIEWEGRDITLIGTIDGLPNPSATGVQFNFKVERVIAPMEIVPGESGVIDGSKAVDGSGEPGQRRGQVPIVPPRLSLAWYAPRQSWSRAAPHQSTGTIDHHLSAGARWQLTVRLKRPHGYANPFGFDYEVWLLERQLRATGYVRADHANTPVALQNRQLQEFVWSVPNVIARGRQWIRSRILSALPNEQYAGVIAALVIGDQRAIGQEDWQIFNRTGIGHLLAISGMHIAMVAGMCAMLMCALWRRSFFTNAQLPLRLPAQKAGVVTGIGVALLYVALAGFGIPAQRAMYMLMVVGIALWCGRITSASHVLCTALGLVLLLDPWAVLWPGFWLSFGAVAIILYASVGRLSIRTPNTSGMSDAVRVAESRNKVARGVKSGLGVLWQSCKSGAKSQYIVTLGLIPLTLLLFGQFSVVSPLANAMAIPLVTLLVLPFSLLGSISPAPLSGWLLSAAHGLIAWLAEWLHWLSSLPFAVWMAPRPAFWMFFLALIGTILLLAPRGWPARWLGLFAWVPLLLNAPTSPTAGQLHVTAFDVGQGMALLLETERHRLLYDTGPYLSPQSDGGSRVILPYLRARGIHHLDTMVVSHSDNDHSGGALSVLEGVDVTRTYSSLPTSHAVVQAAVDHQRCEAGQRWVWDGVTFEMLHPTAHSYANAKWHPNERSCVLRVSLGQQAILLAGDILAAQERELVYASQDDTLLPPVNLQASVLLAPHHGSGTSSTEAFLQAVAPQVALFQMGYRNRFRHPKKEVYERYQRLGIDRLRSDESGAVMLVLDHDKLFYEPYRTAHQRYWYGR